MRDEVWSEIDTTDKLRRVAGALEEGKSDSSAGCWDSWMGRRGLRQHNGRL